MQRLDALVTTLIAALTLSSTAACGPKRVMVDGREMTEDEAADKIYAEGKAAGERGDSETAKVRYRAIINDYSGARKVPDALADLGKIVMGEAGCKPARTYFEQLLDKHGDSPRAPEARTALDRCGGGATQASSGLGALESKFLNATNDAERKEIASKAADSALDAGDYYVGAQWLVKVHDIEQGEAEKRALESEIEELIDNRLSFQEVRALLEETKGDTYPAELLVYKLGRIQYHVRDYANAKTNLERLLSSWPSSKHAAGAKDLLNLMAARANVKPNVIGVLVPLSGKLKAYGENALQAVKLASGELDAKPDNTIKLVVRDSKGDPVESAKAIQDFVVQDGAIAVIGALFRVEAEPAAYKAQELGIPFMTQSAAEGITEAGPYVLRNGLTNQAEAQALVRYAMEVMGMKRFGILYPRHPYGETLLDLFWDTVETRKGEIRAVEAYNSEDTTFTWPVKKLVGRDAMELRGDYHRAIKECDKQPDTYRKSRCKEQVSSGLRPIVDFDGLFIPDYPRALSLIAPALAFEDIIVETDPRYLKRIEKTLNRKVRPVTLLGASGWNSPQLPEKAGRYVENAIFTAGFYPDADDKETVEFVTTFRKQFKRSPELPEALFYDAMKIVRQVVTKEQPATRDAMREALRRVHDFPGVTGSTSFRNGTDADKKVRILTIKNGTIKEAPATVDKPVAPADDDGVDKVDDEKPADDKPGEKPEEKPAEKPADN